MLLPGPIERSLSGRRGGAVGYLRNPQALVGDGVRALRSLREWRAAMNGDGRTAAAPATGGNGSAPPTAREAPAAGANSSSPKAPPRESPPTRYRLQDNEHLAAGVRRVAGEQLDYALWQLTEAIDDPVTAVHEARKSLKKERALLRLVRDSFPPSVYRREDRALRDAGRRLSAARDADVLVETIDQLAERYRARLSASIFSQARSVLDADRRRAREAAAADSGAVEEVAVELRDARGRVAEWPLAGDEFLLIEGGLGRAYQRGAQRFADVLEDPSVENLHEWRKRVKDLWYHVRLVKSMWPDVLGQQAKQASQLADLLGEDHDLAVLAEKLAEPAVAERVMGDLRPLRELAERRRLELQAQARFLGMRLYADRPRWYPRRLGRLWEAWRAEGAQPPTVWG